MVLGNMQHDCPGFEQGKIAFFIGGNLPKGVEGLMRRLLDRTERNLPDLIRLTHFFKGPAHAHVPREPLPSIG